MTNDSLQKKTKALPNTPGVYMMKDEAGKVLYVGKAKRLRTRVRSYFHAHGDFEPRNLALLFHVADIDHVTTPSEVGALMLEARLIKELQPKYNVSLKDGRSYPLLAISQEDDFPRVFVTRERPSLKKPKHVYFGPFPRAGDLRAAVDLLQRVFRFRTCTTRLVEETVQKARRRPCLRYSLRLCSGPCAGRISKQAYASNVAALRMILRGKHNELVDKLARDMADASQGLNYERAAAVRDKIRAVKRLSERGIPSDAMPLAPLAPPQWGAAVADLQKLLGVDVEPRRLEGIDLSNIQGSDRAGAVVTFMDGVPYKDGYRRYKVTAEDDLAMLREVVHRRYRRIAEENAPPADLLLVDGGRGHLVAAMEELLALPVRPAFVVALAKYEGEHLYVLPEPLRTLDAGSDWRSRIGTVFFVARPAFSLLCHLRDEAHRFANAYHRLRRRKREFLKFPLAKGGFRGLSFLRDETNTTP